MLAAHQLARLNLALGDHSAAESLLRGQVLQYLAMEYRMIAHKPGAMDALTIEIEDRLNAPQRVADELHLRLGLRVAVKVVPLGTRPRFEGKGKRFVDQRSTGQEKGTLPQE